MNCCSSKKTRFWVRSPKEASLNKTIASTRPTKRRVLALSRRRRKRAARNLRIRRKGLGGPPQYKRAPQRLGPNYTSRWIEAEYTANTSLNTVYLQEHLYSSEEYTLLHTMYAYVKVQKVEVVVYPQQSAVRTQWLMQWAESEYDNITISSSDATKIVQTHAVAVQRRIWLPPSIIIRAGTANWPISLDGWNSTTELTGPLGSTNIYPGRLLLHIAPPSSITFRVMVLLSFRQGRQPSTAKLTELLSRRVSKLSLTGEEMDVLTQIKRKIKENEEKKKAVIAKLNPKEEECEA